MTKVPEKTPQAAVTLEPSDVPGAGVTKKPEVTGTPSSSHTPGTVDQEGEEISKVTATPVVIQNPTVPDAPANPNVSSAGAVATTAPVVPNNQVPSSPVQEITEPGNPNAPTVTKAPTGKKGSSDKEGKDNETIVEDKVPSELPQTGAIGKFLQEQPAAKGLLFLLPIGVFMAVAGMLERRKNK